MKKLLTIFLMLVVLGGVAFATPIIHEQPTENIIETIVQPADVFAVVSDVSMLEKTAENQLVYFSNIFSVSVANDNFCNETSMSLYRQEANPYFGYSKTAATQRIMPADALTTNILRIN